MQNINAIQVARQLLINKLCQAGCIIDATAGNGNDTLFLAETSVAAATIYAFDIQESAIVATKEKTKKYSDKIHCILASHDCLDSYIDKPIDVAVFNLGYLPGGDHLLTTRATTTLVALDKILSRLSVNGLISIVAYPGHAAGNDEYEQLAIRLADLPRSIFTVGCYKMINHKETSPVLYMIEKVRSE